MAPASSEKQRRLAGADLARKRAGKRTRTGMSEKNLSEFASKPVKSRVKPVKKTTSHRVKSLPSSKAKGSKSYK